MIQQGVTVCEMLIFTMKYISSGTNSEIIN